MTSAPARLQRLAGTDVPERQLHIAAEQRQDRPEKSYMARSAVAGEYIF